MKAVMLSIQPKWCELIANGKKTVEVRKTKPKLETPFKVYIYATNPISKNGLGLCLDKGMFGNLKKVGLLYKRNYETAKQMNMQILSGKVIGEFVCDNISEIFVVCDVHDELPSRPCEYWLDWESDIDDVPKEACLSAKEIMSYLGKQYNGFAWHISNLVIYDEPKELSKFEKPCPYDEACWKCKYYDGGSREEPPSCNWEDFELTRPPQSWCYVEELI